MKSFICWIIFLLLSALTYAPALADPPARPTQMQVLGHILGTLRTTAADHVRLLSENLAHTESTPRLIEDADGWIARYTRIDQDSLGARGVRTGDENEPYVGFVTYVEEVCESRGGTGEEALQGPYQVVLRRKVTEVFRLVNGVWLP